MKKYVVFDWGGQFLKYAYMNEDATILEKDKLVTPSKKSTKEEFYCVLDQAVKKYDTVDGIAISSSGIIDSLQGTMIAVGAFPYLSGVCIKKDLEERYGVPVTIENDGKCAVLAEYWKGNLQGVQDGAVMLIGTNIGGGILLDGKLRRGKDFFAGEYSGVCIDYRHPSDPDSYIAELGSFGLCHRVMGYMELDEEINGEQAFTYINAGDPNALCALKEYTDALALQIFNINLLLNLDKFVIGGGMSQQPKLMEYLQKSIDAIPTYHPDCVAGIQLPMPTIDVCKFYNDANLIGALYYSIQLKKKD